MIIVHQMAKVASRSWIEAAKPATAQGEAPVHCHYIVPRDLEQMQARLGTLRKTISNMVMPNYILRGGRKAWSLVEAARQGGRKIKIITGMRDPVARSISLMMFFIDFIGHVSRPLGPKAQPTAAYVIESLRETWNAVLGGNEPDATFEWMLWRLTGAYANWFEDELLPAYGANIGATPFRSGKAAEQLYTSNADVLVYRVEDMAPASAGHADLLQHAGEFLGMPLRAFPNVNAGRTRRSHALLEELHAHFRLPADMLDRIYAHPVVQHFYAAEEIDVFKRRWREQTA